MAVVVRHGILFIIHKFIMSLVKIVLTVFVLMATVTSHAHSPKIFAHRGGKNNFPENTLYAFKRVVDAGSDGIEVDVQLSKDGVVVLYHPNDLAVWTEGKGPISVWNYSDLMTLDAAYNFDPEANKTFPERSKGHRIATLAEVINNFPGLEIVVDFKSLPAKPLVDAVIKVVDAQHAWPRLIFYSTNEEHLNYLRIRKPEAQVFESRHKTRERLLSLRNDSVCCCKVDPHAYIGFELDREMVVKESFALGEDSNKIHFKLWDNEAMQCIRKASGNEPRVFIFGVSDKQGYEQAHKLGVYAVLSDDPVNVLSELK